MFDLIFAGGWLMLPLILCSIVALAITVERLLALRLEKIAPEGLLAELWSDYRQNSLNTAQLHEIKQQSALGSLLVVGLNKAKDGKEEMTAAMSHAAQGVILQMERFLNTLGTIAVIAPLLGLLGTVVGMIKVFSQMLVSGAGDANLLAGGISEALVTTAAGLSVAIPALVAHRFLLRRIAVLVLRLEQASTKWVEMLQGQRDSKPK